MASVPAATSSPVSNMARMGGALWAAAGPYRPANAWPWNIIRFWTDTLPPSALIRSKLAWVTVSAWSKNQGISPNPPSAAIFSNTSRAIRIVSS